MTPLTPLGVHPQLFKTTIRNRYERFLQKGAKKGPKKYKIELEILKKLTFFNLSAGGGEQEYKIVDDYNAVGSDEKPNLIFGKSESVMDDEGRTNFHQYF